jgi:hypothetical protein
MPGADLAGQLRQHSRETPRVMAPLVVISSTRRLMGAPPGSPFRRSPG